MKHVIKHDLSPELAKKATVKAFESYKAKFADYNPTDKWVTENKAEISFSAKRMTLNGGVELRPGEIELELEVPFIFRVFSGRAMKIVEEEIREWIERAKNGELDDE